MIKRTKIDPLQRLTAADLPPGETPVLDLPHGGASKVVGMDIHNDQTQQLPATIAAFLDAQAARDEQRALPLLTEDAVVVDVADGGEVFRGQDGLRRFVVEAGAGFDYTTEITKVVRDGDVWVVGHHLEGDFPGGTADLDYRFVLEGDRIARLDVVLG